jgi:hypothetical protein
MGISFHAAAFTLALRQASINSAAAMPGLNFLPVYAYPVCIVYKAFNLIIFIIKNPVNILNSDPPNIPHKP